MCDRAVNRRYKCLPPHKLWAAASHQHMQIIFEKDRWSWVAAVGMTSAAADTVPLTANRPTSVRSKGNFPCKNRQSLHELGWVTLHDSPSHKPQNKFESNHQKNYHNDMMIIIIMWICNHLDGCTRNTATRWWAEQKQMITQNNRDYFCISDFAQLRSVIDWQVWISRWRSCCDFLQTVTLLPSFSYDFTAYFTPSRFLQSYTWDMVSEKGYICMTDSRIEWQW